jgi:hypothetical protein
MRKAPFRLRLIQPSGSNETVKCLRTLLREAEAGRLIGVGWVAMYNSREWDYKTCGEVHRNPAWTIGMLQAFSAKLAGDINAQ